MASLILFESQCSGPMLQTNKLIPPVYEVVLAVAAAADSSSPGLTNWTFFSLLILVRAISIALL